MTRAVEAPARHRVLRGIRTWYPIVGPIAAWAVHLVTDTALVRLSCLHPGAVWAMHAVTALTALATVVAMVMAWSMVRDNRDDEGRGTPSGRTRFLGLFALIVGGFNLALILLEGSYVAIIRTCA